MIDIKELRNKKETTTLALARKGVAQESIEEILKLDHDLRELKTHSESLRAEQKRKSKEFGKLKSQNQDVTALQAELSNLKEELHQSETKLTELGNLLQTSLDHIPNPPAEDVPNGSSADDNQIEKTWGELPETQNALPHWEIGERFGFEQTRAAKISGAGFPLLVGPLARLERALIQLFLDRHTTQNGYIEVNPPLLVRKPALYGTGYFPKMEGEQYYTGEDHLYLIPTAEVPLTNIHANEILSLDDLPKKYCAYTPCWRREAGAAGADTRGMIRVHQFSKVEIMQVIHPNQAQTAHEELTRHAEELLEDLGLAYRRLLLCSGDMSFAAAKCYDLEVYAAGVKRWLEVSSCSHFGSFQARRSKIRYREEDPDSQTTSNEFCHTLNGSALALPRIIIALLENGLQPNGDVQLPEILADYYGNTKL